MAHLITPIDVAGTPMCVDGTLVNNLAKITQPVRTGAAPYTAGYGVEFDWDQFANQWLDTGGGMDVERWCWHVMNGASGGIAFGIKNCGISQITLRLHNPSLRVLLNGQDDISVLLNDAVEWGTAADTTAGQAYWNTNYGVAATLDTDTYPYYEGSEAEPLVQGYHEMTIALPERVCGHVIKIIGGQATSNWPVSHPSAWYAQLISVS